MNYLKYSLATVLVALSLFTTITYSSCKGKCKDISCNNGGACEEGVCDCATGFEGDFCDTQSNPCENGGDYENGTCTCEAGFEGTFCETASRLKFIGEWTAGGFYYSYIAQANSTVAVKVTNMAHTFFNAQVDAYINGNTISIPNQIPDNNNRSIQGSGTFDPTTNKITWHYTLYAAPDTIDERTEVWSHG